MNPKLLIAGVVALGALYFWKRQEIVATNGNQAAGPRLPALPALPSLPAVSGAVPNMPSMPKMPSMPWMNGGVIP